MLSKLTGVTFLSSKRQTSDDRIPPMWQVRDAVDFDLENVSFWQAARRLADFAKMDLAWSPYMPTLDSVRNIPAQVHDTPSMQTLLYTAPEGTHTRLYLNFVLDPHLSVLQAARPSLDAPSSGSPPDIQVVGVNFPGQRTVPSQSYLILRSVTAEMRADVAKNAGPIQLLRGNLPAVVATKQQSLSFTLKNGIISDTDVHRVGDWSVKVANSQATPAPAPAAFNGRGPSPDHRFTLLLERLSDKAPPFPSYPGIMHLEPANLEKAPATVSITPSPDGMRQEWTCSFYNSPSVNQLIIEVPLEAKSVTLPFEFKNVALTKN